MNITLTINQESCIKCARCVLVCPMGILSQQGNERRIAANNVETCIKCGHCAAICPTKSIQHSVFGSERVHKFDAAARPTPEQMMLLISSRRSNRLFTNKPVAQESIDMILRAANHAPTASNGRELSYTLITDPEVLKKLSELTLNEIVSKLKIINRPIVRTVVRSISPQLSRLGGLITKMQRSAEAGRDPILKGATGVLLIHAPKGSRYGSQDANLAYQNGSLMAESLGIAQFYTGFVCTVVNDSKPMRKLLGTDTPICAGMAFGMPKFSFTNYIDRDDIEIKRI